MKYPFIKPALTLRQGRKTLGMVNLFDQSWMFCKIENFAQYTMALFCQNISPFILRFKIKVDQIQNKGITLASFLNIAHELKCGLLISALCQFSYGKQILLQLRNGTILICYLKPFIRVVFLSKQRA